MMKNLNFKEIINLYEEEDMKKNEKHIKKLTLLHSNDLHGDFYEELVNEKFTGGVSMLSGYVMKEREKKTPCVFTISGDMFRGSIIDSEYKGFSTVDIMNVIGPDVVSLGNHELDYGLAQLLFLEKVASFPIVTANLYIKGVGKRLFKPYLIYEVDGIKILFIGVITDEIIAYSKMDELIESFVSVEDAAQEISKVCNAYKSIDIDLTVVLSHIGYENDLKLAEKISKDAGVDLILGGHSHTILEKPTLVNDILIAQAGCGTDQIGRFDLEIDMDTNSIHRYKWELVPITQDHCPKDRSLERLLKNYSDSVEIKYNVVLTRLHKKLSYPNRYQECEAGNFFADCLQDALGVDIMMVGSGSLRKFELNDIITLKELKEFFPFQDSLYLVKMDGKTLKKLIKTLFHKVYQKKFKEFYQWSRGIQITYDVDKDKIISILYQGKRIGDSTVFNVGIQDFQYENSKEFVNIDLTKLPNKKIGTSDQELMKEYLTDKTHLDANIEGRIILLNAEKFDFNN